MSEAFEDDSACVYTKGESAWSATDLVHQETHVLPLYDVIAHELAFECVCGPELSYVVVELGGIWRFMKHHALAEKVGTALHS